MDAAERVFLASGVKQARMDQIAQAAELSKGTLYLYFKSKDELYLAIAVRALRQLIDIWQAVREQGNYQTGYELYKLTLESFIQFALSHRDRFLVTLGWTGFDYSLPNDTPAFAEYQAVIQESARYGYEALELGKQDGSIRADLDSASTAFHIWGGAVGMLMLIFSAKETSSRLPFELDLHQALLDHLTALLSSLRHPLDPAAIPEQLARLFERQ